MNLHPVPEPAATALIYARVSTKEQAQGGGDVDGFSLPAQREACRRKAESLNATVVGEFVDRGESARTADRPELQRLLTALASEPVDFVIVHKIDRLARNRGDDVALTAAITASGARLVSVTENIDETPSGMLLHGIMSSIAEFYSRNLANEVVKGTQQKVLAGGTPTRAPIGYRNVRNMVDGYEVRTVEVDPERAPLITWAFEAYATGDWSLSSLADELEARGLTSRPGPKTPERPVPHNKLHKILRNRYYIGVVTWRGVEYDGKHPPLVEPQVFDRVQQVLADHRTSGERSYRRDHYLVGSLRCGICSNSILYTVSRGRGGHEYGYFYCSSRYRSKACGQRYLPEHLVEVAVEAQWARESMSGTQIGELQAELAEEIRRHEAEIGREVERLQHRAHALRRERFKWAEKVMAGAVPDDVASVKQRGLAKQLAAIEAEITRRQSLHEVDERALERLFALVANAGEVYQQADVVLRRAMIRGLVRAVDHHRGPRWPDGHRCSPSADDCRREPSTGAASGGRCGQ